jgi:MerR family transcriptional regulator/heat shock protein HspR
VGLARCARSSGRRRSPPLLSRCLTVGAAEPPRPLRESEATESHEGGEAAESDERRRRESFTEGTMAKRTGKAYYMISAVAQKYNIHPQTLRLYEREGLLKPSRTEGNTRLYSEEDLEQLETILSLTRDLGVNLAGVEIILNMRRKMEGMQAEVNEFMEYVKHELARGMDDWEQRLGTALVKSAPTDLVRTAPPPPSDDEAVNEGERPTRKKN